MRYLEVQTGPQRHLAGLLSLDVILEHSDILHLPNTPVARTYYVDERLLP